MEGNKTLLPPITGVVVVDKTLLLPTTGVERNDFAVTGRKTVVFIVHLR
jgi:hypothetical protein